MSSTTRNVLITGCSSGGIGAALAFEYQQPLNFHVFATARNIAKIPQSLTSQPNVTALTLDVTSEESIKNAVKAVGHLDVLINNSGSALSVPVLDTDLQHSRDMFEVNVIGLLAVTKAFVPLMVGRKDAAIVNVGSINGETNLPFTGVYGSSKAAAMLISETLRLEIRPLGIRVVTLSTGIIETNLHANEPVQSCLPAGSYYKPVEQWIRDRQTGTNRPPAMPVEEYAKTFVKKVEDEKKAGVVRIGPLTWLFVWLKWWMPVTIWDYFMVQTGPERFYEKIASGLKGKMQ